MTIDEQQHKQKMKELGRFGGLMVIFFVVMYIAVYLNIMYSPTVPWFLLVLVVGGYYIVPKAKNVMSMFDDKRT